MRARLGDVRRVLGPYCALSWYRESLERSPVRGLAVLLGLALFAAAARFAADTHAWRRAYLGQRAYIFGQVSAIARRADGSLALVDGSRLALTGAWGTRVVIAPGESFGIRDPEVDVLVGRRAAFYDHAVFTVCRPLDPVPPGEVTRGTLAASLALMPVRPWPLLLYFARILGGLVPWALAGTIIAWSIARHRVRPLALASAFTAATVLLVPIEAVRLAAGLAQRTDEATLTNILYCAYLVLVMMVIGFALPEKRGAGEARS